MTRHDTDIIVISDFRLPGGTTNSLAQEIRAQSGAGYRTHLIHAPSRLVGKVLPWSPSINSVLDLPHVTVASPRATLHAKLIIIRHPTVLESTGITFPNISADDVLMVANNAAQEVSGKSHYNVAGVDSKLRRLFGVRPWWAPIGPVVRRTIADQEPEIQMLPSDWLNLVDTGSLAPARTGFVADVPVIGRHSRPQAAKWPATSEEILDAYPDSDEYRVEVLGGAEVVADVVGRVPDRWRVIPFGGANPTDFLRGIDFWVYFHHHEMQEAYGRAAMEALAAGAVAILPHYLRATFGDAALYASPHEVKNLVSQYREDLPRFLDQSAKGQEFVEKLSPQLHAERLASMGVMPGVRVEPVGDARSHEDSELEPTTPVLPREGRRILFVTSNGAGMGHLTRLLAVATRLPQDAQAVFASLSTGVDIVERFDIPYEYIGSSGSMSMESGAWNRYAVKRFKQLLDAVDPDVFVFDGTWPYGGMKAALTGREIEKVWVRRPMWKADAPTTSLEASDFFDKVIEPGEFAAGYDPGPTTSMNDAETVAPVTLLSAEQVLNRVDARVELGYPQDQKVALVTLGAGNINDIGSLQENILSWFQAHAPQWRVVVTRPPIAHSEASDAVETLQVYPLARYTRAFDFAVSASGYNAFHEWMVGELPTLWVPNLATRTDDQYARARWAADLGLGGLLESEAPASVAEALLRMTDDQERRRMFANLTKLDKTNGAEAAARLLSGTRVAAVLKP